MFLLPLVSLQKKDDMPVFFVVLKLVSPQNLVPVFLLRLPHAPKLLPVPRQLWKDSHRQGERK